MAGFKLVEKCEQFGLIVNQMLKIFSKEPGENAKCGSGRQIAWWWTSASRSEREVWMNNSPHACLSALLYIALSQWHALFFYPCSTAIELVKQRSCSTVPLKSHCCAFHNVQRYIHLFISLLSDPHTDITLSLVEWHDVLQCRSTQCPSLWSSGKLCACASPRRRWSFWFSLHLQNSTLHKLDERLVRTARSSAYVSSTEEKSCWKSAGVFLHRADGTRRVWTWRHIWESAAQQLAVGFFYRADGMTSGTCTCKRLRVVLCPNYVLLHMFVEFRLHLKFCFVLWWTCIFSLLHVSSIDRDLARKSLFSRRRDLAC